MPDPKGRPVDEVRAVRDNIKVRVAELIQAEELKKEAAGLFSQLRQTTIKQLFPAFAGRSGTARPSLQFDPQYSVAINASQQDIGLAAGAVWLCLIVVPYVRSIEVF